MGSIGNPQIQTFCKPSPHPHHPESEAIWIRGDWRGGGNPFPEGIKVSRWFPVMTISISVSLALLAAVYLLWFVENKKLKSQKVYSSLILYLLTFWHTGGSISTLVWGRWKDKKSKSWRVEKPKSVFQSYSLSFLPFWHTGGSISTLVSFNVKAKQ